MIDAERPGRVVCAHPLSDYCPSTEYSSIYLSTYLGRYVGTYPGGEGMFWYISTINNLLVI